MAKLDNRKRVIGIKSKRLFTSQPSGATQYAERLDGAIFTRRLEALKPVVGYVTYTKWERLDNARLAEYLRTRPDGSYCLTINGVGFDRRQTNRLRLPQDLGI